MSRCLHRIHFSDYMKLILAAKKRIELDIQELDVKKLKGFKEYKKNENLE
jgi:hypothetical protein